jgi:hypothetical protein
LLISLIKDAKVVDFHDQTAQVIKTNQFFLSVKVFITHGNPNSSKKGIFQGISLKTIQKPSLTQKTLTLNLDSQKVIQKSNSFVL